jgi:GLPGLI family protein
MIRLIPVACLFILLGCLGSPLEAQTVKVQYKKFIVPGNTDYGRWVSSPAQKREMREREEKIANTVSEYYTLITNGKQSFFAFDTLIQTSQIEERDSWWRRANNVKMTQAKDLRKGTITHRSPLLSDSVCQSENFRTKYQWTPAEGLRIFAGLPCQKLIHLTEEKDSIIVWYTPEIPMNDGPEVFGGAPGLILAVEAPNFNYIAEEVEVGEFEFPKAPLPAENCLKEKDFQQKMRTAAIQEFMKND